MPDNRYEMHEVVVRIRGSFANEQHRSQLNSALGRLASRLDFTYDIGEPHIEEMPEAVLVMEDFHAAARRLGHDTSSGSRTFNGLRRTCGVLPQFRHSVGRVVSPDGELVDYVSSHAVRYFHTHDRHHIANTGKVGRSILDEVITHLDANAQDTPGE